MWATVQKTIDAIIANLGAIRLDGLILYCLGIIYYTYLHYKHDKDIVIGLKGDNGKWEAPEYVIYIWCQSFPFILFGDAFLGLRLGDGMMFSYNLILLFAILGRAGIEMMLAFKMKITGQILDKVQPEQPKTDGQTN